jgi:multidrug efflux pump subunit AcrB
VRTQLPATIVGSFQGRRKAFQDSLTGLGVILLMAIFVIYVVLGILYESFIHPLTILSGLPAAVSARSRRCGSSAWISICTPSSASSCSLVS